MEPNYGVLNVVAIVLPFLFYYLGIVIRKIALPGKDSPPLSHQFLLGIPVSLVIVSPILPVLAKTYSDIPALLVTLGLIVENGMVVNEAAVNQLKKLQAKL